MLAKIRDYTWKVLNMQHITPNSKRWVYTDIPSDGTWNLMGELWDVYCEEFD